MVHAAPSEGEVPVWVAGELQRVGILNRVLVAFVDLAKHGEVNFVGFTRMVLDDCARLLESRERFAQTGVGWVLRELSRSDQTRVVGFVEANLDRFSRETLKNATKYLPPEEAEHFLRAHLPSGSRPRRLR